jgi:hypothetical protein
MRYGVRALIGLTTATVVFATACSDSTTSPSATAPVFADSAATDANLLGGLLGGVLGTVGNLLATPVHRSEALANDVSWTFTASPYGSRSSNASVGLSIYVPPGAVDRYTTIRVTALKGSAVAYRFEPHMEFDRKVTLTQSLSGLKYGLLGTGLLNLSPFKGAHFEGDTPTYNDAGQALVTEIVGAVLNLLSNNTSFGVNHFSGWIVASGYDSNRDSSH